MYIATGHFNMIKTQVTDKSMAVTCFVIFDMSLLVEPTPRSFPLFVHRRMMMAKLNDNISTIGTYEAMIASTSLQWSFKNSGPFTI